MVWGVGMMEIQYIEAVYLLNPTDDNSINRVATVSQCPKGHINRPLLQKSDDEDYEQRHAGAPWAGYEVGTVTKMVKCSKCKMKYEVEIELWSS